MLIVIRSNINDVAKFNKGDKLVAANVIGNNTIEYVVNRAVRSYVLKNIVHNKYIAIKKGEAKMVDIVDQAKFFKTYKAAKLYYQTLSEQTTRDIDIIEVID